MTMLPHEQKRWERKFRRMIFASVIAGFGALGAYQGISAAVGPSPQERYEQALRSYGGTEQSFLEAGKALAADIHARINSEYHRHPSYNSLSASYASIELMTRMRALDATMKVGTVLNYLERAERVLNETNAGLQNNQDLLRRISNYEGNFSKAINAAQDMGDTTSRPKTFGLRH